MTNNLFFLVEDSYLEVRELVHGNASHAKEKITNSSKHHYLLLVLVEDQGTVCSSETEAVGHCSLEWSFLPLC